MVHELLCKHTKLYKIKCVKLFIKGFAVKILIMLREKSGIVEKQLCYNAWTAQNITAKKSLSFSEATLWSV